MRTAGLIDDRGIVANRAAGYMVRDDGVVLNQDWASPTANSTADGSLYLTVLDYGKWEAALDAQGILKPESWAEVYRPVRLASGKTYPYGFGWHLAQRVGQEIRWHGGSWQGFQTFFIRYPSLRLAVVTLANSLNADPQSIARGVAALLEPRLEPVAGVPIEDREPRVTERLRSILASQRIPDAENSSFDPQRLEAQRQAYQARRQSFGRLMELHLFAREERGDDRFYCYRARFEHGLLGVVLGLGPEGHVRQFSLPSVDDWRAPITECQ